MPEDGDEDVEVDAEATHYPLDLADLDIFKAMAARVRAKLFTAHPAFIRTACVVLIALERLPKVTPGACIRVCWRTRRISGEWKWADICVSEEAVRAGLGAHYYDRGVGGDTESETLFTAYVGAQRLGDLAEWAKQAQSVAEAGYLTLHDEWAGQDHIDWSADDDS
jgi:hypothetical protein